MRRLLVLVALTLAAVVNLTPPVPVGAHGPFCGIRWGSLPKEGTGGQSAAVTSVRAGRHERLYLLVFHLGPSGGVPGAGVWYRAGCGLGGHPLSRAGAATSMNIFAPLSPGPFPDVSSFTTLRYIDTFHTERGSGV